MPTTSEWLRQAAAIPVRGKKICLVTSSNGKRWVVPKGLIETSNSAAETALVEAWEEAGLVGILQPDPIGSYLYTKLGRTYHVTVYLMRVTEAADEWPEKNSRQRAWVPVDRALEQLDDAGLRELVKASRGREAPEKEQQAPEKVH
jgi:8-oxo-dGTP pyrophosphatase MutT (NUDIX family)